MRLEFEDWILSQKISETAGNLFAEAIACYRASAYRAALLFSYLGFQTVVRDRLLSARRPPTGINNEKWQRIVENLRDDDKWDDQVFHVIQRRPPAATFKLSDDIRRQVHYWRDRRHDCAHWKGNVIRYPQVESFWLFVRSNLAKFVVGGSKEGLLEDIRVHFDRAQTPAGADCGAIVRQMPSGIAVGDLSEFFEAVHKVFVELRMQPSNVYAEDEVGFFDDMLDVADPAFAESLADFLQRKEDLLVAHLKRNPSRLPRFAHDPTFIRRLWYQSLVPAGQREFALYCALLRNQLIPSSELQEAHRRVTSFLRDVTPLSEFLPILEESGFFVAFKEVVFLESDSSSGVPLADVFAWANSNWRLVVQYLDRCGMDSDIAQSLSRIFSKDNYPFSLRDGLGAYLSSNPAKRDKFLAVFRQHQIRLPDHLSFEPIGDENPF